MIDRHVKQLYMTKKQEAKVITWQDLRSIFARGKKALFLSFFSGLMMGGLMLCTTSISYQAKASFQEGKESAFSKEQMLQDLLIAKTLEPSQESKTIALMQSVRVLKPLIHEMGMQAKVEKEGIFFFFDRIKEHWQSQMGLFSLEPKEFLFEKIDYLREKPFSCSLVFQDKDHFYLMDEKEKVYKIGTPVIFPDFSWVLKQVPYDVEIGKSYRITFLPWQVAYQQLLDHLKIKPLKVSGKEQKSIYQLFFSAKDRFFATEVINRLIFSYKKVIQEDADLLVQEQLSYLKKKEQEMGEHLSSLFSDYSLYLQSLLTKEGVGGSHQQVELLTRAYQENVEKIAKIDQELQKKPFLGKKELPFSAEIEKKKIALEKLQKEEKELSLDFIASQGSLDSFLIKKDLLEESQDLDKMVLLLKEVETFLEKSGARLEMIDRLLEIDDFSLFSLSIQLQDPFLQKISEKAFPLWLLFQDKEHSSEKEKRRWEEELSLQKTILIEHLQKLKVAELIEIQNLEEKKHLLERKKAFLVRKEAKELEEDVEEMEKTQKKLLQDEKFYAEQKLEEIKKAFDLFPERWRKEKWLEIQTHLETKWIQSIQEMIESKTIGHQLHSLESKELDLATLPLKPRALFFLFLLGGSFLFLFSTATTLFFSAFLKGFPVSYEQLKRMGFFLLGKTSFLDEVIPKVALFSQEKVITLFLGDGVDYSFSLQKFLQEQGKDVLFLRPSLQELGSFGLEEEIAHQKKEKEQLFIVIRASIRDPQSLMGLKISQQSVISVGKESVEELYSFIEWVKKRHQMGWVVVDGSEK